MTPIWSSDNLHHLKMFLFEQGESRLVNVVCLCNKGLFSISSFFNFGPKCKYTWGTDRCIGLYGMVSVHMFFKKNGIQNRNSSCKGLTHS